MHMPSHALHPDVSSRDAADLRRWRVNRPAREEPTPNLRGKADTRLCRFLCRLCNKHWIVDDFWSTLCINCKLTTIGCFQSSENLLLDASWAFGCALRTFEGALLISGLFLGLGGRGDELPRRSLEALGDALRDPESPWGGLTDSSECGFVCF